MKGHIPYGNRAVQDVDINVDVKLVPTYKNIIVLPLIALGFDVVSVILFFIASTGLPFSNIIIIFALLLPIAGIITGVIALCRGKRRNGIFGMIIAIVAIALPLSVIVFIGVIFIGIVTGAIAFM